MESASLQASPNAETTQSFFRSLSVKEGKNDRLNLPDSARNYRRVRSSDLWMSLLSLPDGSSGVTPQSRLNPEASTDQDSPSRRSPLVGSLFSTCPSSEIIEATSSVSLPSTEENEIWLEFPMAEYNERGGHRHSSFAVSSFEDLYHRYAQFVAKVESFWQDSHEESIGRKKAENDVIDAIGRAKASATMYADLLRHRIEIEESLERIKEEVEEMKCELVAVMNAHQSQIADSDMDNFDFGGVMDVVGFANNAEDPSLSPLNKKKRRADKGKAIAETTVVPHSVPHTTRGSDAHAFREFGFPHVDSSVETEIMLGCVNEKLIENFKSKKAAAMRRIMHTNHRKMIAMEEKVLRNLEKFEKRAVEKDRDKKKAVAAVQSLLDKAMAASKKKNSEINQLHKVVDQLRKKLETADDEVVARYKMSAEYKSSLYMYGAESLKAAIKMTKE